MSPTSSTKPFNPFRSARLIYRAVNDTPEDEAFVHAIGRDAEAQSGANYGLLRPESKENSNKWREDIKKSLLGVVICLAPTTPASEEGQSKSKAETEGGSGSEDSGEPVGILTLKALPPSHAPHRWTDVGIDIARRHRGKGYGAEAIRWSLWWAFQMAGLHRVQIQAFSFNAGAMKLYQRLGFKEEGRLREHMWFDGGWHDNMIYGMLEDDWREGQRKAGRDLSSCV
ncbi:putative GNAT family acetyltransferase [Xylariaceae sp. FL0594]|nr:putative GNAT family acetyltransferase [Xylariaceae sp. FL0594]